MTTPTFTGIKFPAMIAPDGTPFLQGVVYKSETFGAKITGNGTCAHPLDINFAGLDLVQNVSALDGKHDYNKGAFPCAIRSRGDAMMFAAARDMLDVIRQVREMELSTEGKGLRDFAHNDLQRIYESTRKIIDSLK